LIQVDNTPSQIGDIWLAQNSDKAKIRYTSFPVASCRLPRNKSATGLQHKRQVHNKSVTIWRGQKLATSWQLLRIQGSYGETCVMDFGQYVAHVAVAQTNYCSSGPVTQC